MSSSGYLVSPKEDASKEDLWNETWKRIDRFLPDLRNDLVPDEPEARSEKRTKEQSKDETEQELEKAEEPIPPVQDKDEKSSGDEKEEKASA